MYIDTYMEGGCIVVEKTQGGHNATQHHDQRHNTENTESLQLERVPLIQAFQFIIFKPKFVPRSPFCCLNSMVHNSLTVMILLPDLKMINIQY